MDGEDKAHTLPGEGTQVNIHNVVEGLVLLAPAPEIADGAGGGHVIELEGHIAAKTVLASHAGVEAVSGLDGEGRIDALNVPVITVLGGNQQGGCGSWRAVLQAGGVRSGHKAACIAFGPRARKQARAAAPLRRAGVALEVIAHLREGPARHVDLHPDGQ